VTVDEVPQHRPSFRGSTTQQQQLCPHCALHVHVDGPAACLDHINSARFDACARICADARMTGVCPEGIVDWPVEQQSEGCARRCIQEYEVQADCSCTEGGLLSEPRNCQLVRLYYEQSCCDVKPGECS